ncbi:hypothetical protein [Sphingosinicella sp. BN140058]|uniref:hypothetical protein n=1 Tax=Sphingosinicella sp. BN140058 TaxID=1892855 RepID=UPI00101278AA|nr:hypothetical protein [Sphingosinicella sp. BN140058]QAY77162.1 hypothetical protein ETR14_12115 [Sphingosinicella sp. BN140058]
MPKRTKAAVESGATPSLIEQVNQVPVSVELLLHASKAIELATDANTVVEMVAAVADDLQGSGYTIGQGAVLGMSCHFRLAALSHYMASNGRSFAAEGQPGGDDVNRALLQCAGMVPLVDDDGPTRFESGFMDRCIAIATGVQGSA